jgi:CHAD domain-containing protein
MPYRLQTEEQVPDGLRRCAREQLERAIDELTAGVKDDPVKAVHSARKALKKTRSLLRLSRGTIDRAERRRENAALRHAGRTLSAARDAEVMLQAVDELSERFAGQLPQITFDAIRRRLEAERDPARQRLLESGLTDRAAEELKAVRDRIDHWSLQRGGWKALEPGLVRSYARGRGALERARREPTMENLHEWRKRTKDLWYHLRMLGPISPGIMGGYAKEAERLSELLGDDHDLALLRQTLEGRAGELPVDLEAVLGLVDHRREQLQAEAMMIGERLYAERPKAFLRRLHRYWSTTRDRSRRAAQTHRPVALT